MARSSRQRIGDRYEDLALRHLAAAGLKLVTRKYLCRFGEIDLVMRDAEVVVFAEVRYRGDSSYSMAAATVTPAKRKRILKSAEYFLIKHREFRNQAVRFDVVAFDKAPADLRADRIQWFRDAFRPGFY